MTKPRRKLWSSTMTSPEEDYAANKKKIKETAEREEIKQRPVKALKRFYSTPQGCGGPHPTPWELLWPDGPPEEQAAVRTFASGANRDVEEGKIDPEGALSPLVIQAFCEYMQEKTLLADGTTRAADNWQKGIPLDSYMQSMMRHVLDVWMAHRNGQRWVDQQEALCALMFNVHGYLHVLLSEPRK